MSKRIKNGTKNPLGKLLPLLLTLAMLFSMITPMTAAYAAEQDQTRQAADGVAVPTSAAKLVIGFMYIGVDSASAGTNSFVEIYNPNDFTVSLTDVYSLQYKSMAVSSDAKYYTPDWIKLNLEGAIPAHCSFLVNLGATGVVTPNGTNGRLDLRNKQFDQNFVWPDGLQGFNKGVKFVIMSNQDQLPSGLANPFTGDGAGQVPGYVDMYGVSGNDNTAPSVDGYETQCIPAGDSEAQSKQKGFVRLNKNDGAKYEDTDNNIQDFQQVDFRSSDLSDANLIPRDLADGAWQSAQPPVEPVVAQISDLTVNVGADASQMNFNWFSDASDSGTPAVQIDGLGTILGTQGVVSVIANTNWNKVSVSGLAPGTTYKFRVTNNGTDYSQDYSFTTTTPDNFTFAAVGDPQMGASGNVSNDVVGWTKTVGEILKNGASFIAGTGDQINTSTNQNEYAAFISGLNQNNSIVTFAPALGNHEGTISNLYGYHYNTPNNATQVVDGITLGDYYYMQNNVLFVVLDTAPYPTSVDDAKQFIAAYDSELATATAACSGQYDWVIVQTHKSEMSNADHYNDSDINYYSLAGFEDLMTKYDVDLVLTGHDHSYVRTYALKSSGGPLVTNGIAIDQSNLGDELVNPDGTVYMVLDSASGSKFYAPKNTPKFTSKVEYQSNVPEYTMVNVSGDKLTVTTYEATGNTIDSFSIEKTPSVVPASVKDLTVNVGADASQMNFDWLSDVSQSGTPSVKIDGVGIFTGAQGIVTTSTNDNWNKVTATGLAPNTTYIFEVTNDGVVYSQDYSFTTTGSGDFTFAAVGDPQMGASGNVPNDAAGWVATVNEIMSKGASFIAGTGDQINTSANQNEYAAFISGLNQDGSIVTFAPAMGNHEATVSGLFASHYNVPNLSDEAVNGVTLGDYYYIQNNVLFVVLDTAPYPANADDAKQYIDAYDNVLATATEACAGQYDWLVVQTHKSQMSNADHWNDSDINYYSLAGFEDLMTKYDVDLVLTGHDHSYVRTYALKSSGGPLVTNGIAIDQNNLGDELINPDGTVYMVLDSASGSKFYAPKNTPKFTSKVEYQSNIPEYTMIDVSGNKLTVTTYEVGNENIVDSFTIEKAPVTVAFDLNGGNSPTINPVSVKAGETITLPAAPTKSEDVNNTYAFAGWFTDRTGGAQFTASTPVTANITVYAQWTVTPKPVNAIKITSALASGNGQADVNFAIRSANGKGYTVYVATSANGKFELWDNFNANSKGIHLKGLANGVTYYAYVQYTDGKITEKSDIFTVTLVK